MNRARPATLLLLSAVGLLLVAPSSASGHVAPRSALSHGLALPHGSVSSNDDDRAVAQLRRAAVALEQVTYSGSRIVSVWGSETSTTALMDVEHVPGQGTLVRLRGGGIAEDTAAFLGSAEEGHGHQRGLDLDSVQLLTESYDVWTGGTGRVAGRSAAVVEIGRDGSRVARMWIDDATGLPLRREIFDAEGHLANESAFLELEVHREGFIAHLPPSPPEESSDLFGLPAAPDEEATRWSCPQQVGSLRLVGVERMDSTAALHMSYSDGLSRVSVFEQAGSLDEQDLAGFRPQQIDGATVYLREGLPSYAVWEDSGTVYTAVSDAPVDTVTEVVRAYPHTASSSDSGFWGRVAAGFGRLGAWVTPLV